MAKDYTAIANSIEPNADRRTMRTAMLEAAREAGLDAPERATLRVLMRFYQDDFETEAMAHAVAEGLMPAGAKPDGKIEGPETWIMLIELFIKLMPYLLEWFSSKGLLGRRLKRRMEAN